MDASLYQEMFELEQRFWWFVAKHAIIEHLLGRYVRPVAGERPVVGDLGCGSGALLARLSRQYSVVGMDSSAIARDFCLRRGLEVRDGRLPDELPFADGSLDAVILSDVLEHVERDGEAIVAVARLLRPGGIVICTVPAHPWLWTHRDEFHHHFRRYTRIKFENVFKAAPLSRVLISYYNCFLFGPMAVARLISKWIGMDRHGPDIHMPPEWLNWILRVVFEGEKYLLPYLRVPVGASLISVHRRDH